MIKHVIYPDDNIECAGGILGERAISSRISSVMAFIPFGLWSAYRVLYISNHFPKDFINISGFDTFNQH